MLTLEKEKAKEDDLYFSLFAEAMGRALVLSSFIFNSLMEIQALTESTW